MPTVSKQVHTLIEGMYLDGLVSSLKSKTAKHIHGTATLSSFANKSATTKPTQVSSLLSAQALQMWANGWQ